MNAQTVTRPAATAATATGETSFGDALRTFHAALAQQSEFDRAIYTKATGKYEANPYDVAIRARYDQAEGRFNEVVCATFDAEQRLYATPANSLGAVLDKFAAAAQTEFFQSAGDPQVSAIATIHADLQRLCRGVE